MTVIGLSLGAERCRACGATAAPAVSLPLGYYCPRCAVKTAAEIVVDPSQPQSDRRLAHDAILLIRALRRAGRI